MDLLSELTIIVVVTLLLSAVLTSMIRNLALSYGLVDRPNERSSHELPTPRGGGGAIAVAVTLAMLVLAVVGSVSTDVVLALVLGGGLVAVIGLIDDRRPLSPVVRLVVHVAAALWALFALGGLPPLQIGGALVQFGWVGYVLGTLGIVWTLNLFNFMDGVDGIAASEALFISVAGAAIGVFAGSAAIVPAALVLGGACFGFLLWNWPPAKIFMGDVGSGYLGYVIAVMALAAARESSVALIVWFILGAAFFVDATATLVCRLARGQRFHEAHRTHAYQRLARRWHSHRRVTLTVLAVNVIWLLPAAWLAALHPERAALVAVLASVPILATVLALGAGREDSRDH